MIRSLFTALLLFPLLAHAAEVAGVKLPDAAKVAGHELHLNGAALRQQFVFKVYVAALYLPSKLNGAAQVLAASGPKRISMVTLREISAQQLIDALRNGIRRNHTPAEVDGLRPMTEVLNGIMMTIGTAPSGSAITLDFIPGAGTQIGLNGAPQGKPFGDAAFYQALMKIWLGDDPVDDGMKKALLGNP